MKTQPQTNIFGLLLGLFATVPALADDPVLEEVVVSGYRQKPVIETDLSLSLLDARTIAESTVVNIEELIPLVPNLNLSGEGSRARYLQLRGIGEREQYEGEGAMGRYLDDD